MAQILKGAPVTEALTQRSIREVEELKAKGIEPCLAILRVGERPDDIAYEKGAVKKADAVGVKVKKVVLPGDVSQEDFDRTLTELNEDSLVHGILMFRPLPAQLDNEKPDRCLTLLRTSTE